MPKTMDPILPLLLILSMLGILVHYFEHFGRSSMDPLGSHVEQVKALATAPSTALAAAVSART